MTLTFSDEQEELRASVRRFLLDKAPTEAVRRAVETDEGHDPAVWGQMANQLGLHGIALPEEHGGMGFGAVELGIVLEELGRALSPEPFLSTVALSGRALAVSTDTALQERWLPGIVEGTVTAALAVAEPGGGWNADAVSTVAERSGDGYVLTGTKNFVIGGESADLLLVVAVADDAPALFAIDAVAGPEGLTRTRLAVLDETRRLARIDLEGTPAQRVDAPAGHLRRVLDLSLIALAAEQVGTAQACLDLSVEYAKVRVQFGRPIGSFQAIKHKCATMLVQLEAARSALYHAASLAADPDADPVELAAAAAVCAAWVGDTAVQIAKETIQIHGGIGYTWEHDSHLFLKRAKSSELLFDTPAVHRARLADLVGM
ncbi:acyl-CoA dehydrogenase family protein [Williamsia sp. R60]